MTKLDKGKTEAKQFFDKLGERLEVDEKNKGLFNTIKKEIGKFNQDHKEEKVGAKAGRIQENGEITEYVFVRRYTDVPKLKRTNKGEYELDKTSDGKVRTVWNTLAMVKIKGPNDKAYISGVNLENELKDGLIKFETKEADRQTNLDEMTTKSSKDWEPINQLNRMMKEERLNVFIIERDAKPNEKLTKTQEKVQRLFVCDRNYPDPNEQFTFRRTIGGDKVNEAALNKACLEISKLYLDDAQSLKRNASIEGIMEEELADI